MKNPKVSNKQNMYIIAGILAVVVVSGIMLSQTAFLTPQINQAPVEQAEPVQTASENMPESTGVSIFLTNSPSVAYVNSPIRFLWSIESNDQVLVSHTAIHYDTKSVPSPKAYTDYAKAGRFLEGDAPGKFSDSMTVQETGTYYYRAHAVVGGEGIWTDEKSFTVSTLSGR